MDGLVSLFVDNIPEKENHLGLRKIFSRYGVVRDVFIPFKKSKTGSKFGFVRYDCSIAADMGILRANGLVVDDKKLLLKSAPSDKRKLSQHHVHKPQSRASLAESNKIGEKRNYQHQNHNVDHLRTFAEALNGSAKNMNFSGKGKTSLKFQPCGNVWLYRSAVAVLHRMISVEELREDLKKEIVSDFQLRAMGGRSILVTFHSIDLRDEMINNDWYKLWFASVKAWNGEAASAERLVSISCTGIPLNIWNLHTFKKIGGLWGDFITIDEDTLKETSFTKANILVATMIQSTIEEEINLDVNGRTYLVRVFEESSSRFPLSIHSLSSHKEKINACQI
ncbi:hypothetical protein Vadar_027431 [Vaccinium darrowii]|uniref:Uncharacterized protein n=1 Tax=Vaccinium darrowii TaxID=229202 RepID=A0ACB7YG68_9ERIC|nr:hypothetical protein Vadar_027431 [Vaccinium darrowii]